MDRSRPVSQFSTLSVGQLTDPQKKTVYGMSKLLKLTDLEFGILYDREAAPTVQSNFHTLMDISFSCQPTK